MNCKDIEPILGCWHKADGSTETVVVHYTYGVNAAGVEIIAAVRYATVDGTPIALAVGEAVTPGACAVASAPVIGDGYQIAGATRAATPAFTGAVDTFNTSAIPGMLQSVTVTAFATTAGLPGATTNQVIVAMPGGNKINLAPGETRTWSVQRDQDIQLEREYDITATGNAYATITWTYVT